MSRNIRSLSSYVRWTTLLVTRDFNPRRPTVPSVRWRVLYHQLAHRSVWRPPWSASTGLPLVHKNKTVKMSRSSREWQPFSHLVFSLCHPAYSKHYQISCVQSFSYTKHRWLRLSNDFAKVSCWLFIYSSMQLERKSKRQGGSSGVIIDVKKYFSYVP